MVEIPFVFLAAALALAFGVFLIWVLFRVFVVLGKGIGWTIHGAFRLVRHVFVHLGRIVADVVRAIGALTAALFMPVAVVLSVARGRWSAGRHYGKAFTDELENAAAALYRAALGHPLRLVGLGAMLEGVERRVPEVVAAAPGPDRPSGGPAKGFPGYVVEGSLPAGGSGARLWLARATPEKQRQLTGAFGRCPERVVIKAFDLASGSTLPQIVRENRALEAARRLGLVLEHQMTSDRFHYVMPYVPGADLSEEARRLHGKAPPDGLTNAGLRTVVDHGVGLLSILERFHAAGLWHKDIKPSNIIVGDGHVELVDFGLVTPLASAMTLTTHGTEYYRDPEMVRLAMRGVKVHEVDGVKFDLYSAGAVLYFLIEHSFPAHGSLSGITKRCPDALRWIVRRSMASLESRYASANEMLRDLQVVQAAGDPFALRPADLPSMGGRAAEVERAVAAGEPRHERFERAAALGGPVAAAFTASMAAAEAHRRHRRHGGPGLAVALGLFLGLLVLFGGGLFLAPSSMSREVMPTMHAQAASQAAREFAADRERARDAVSDARRVERDLARMRYAHGELRIDRAGRSSSAAEHAQTLAAALDGLELLLLPASPAGSKLGAVVDFEERLRRSNELRVLDDTDPDAVDRVARARATIGLAPFGDDAARRRLNAAVWDDGLADAVLWYEVGRSGRELDYWLVLADEDHATLASVLHLLWVSTRPTDDVGAAREPAARASKSAPTPVVAR